MHKYYIIPNERPAFMRIIDYNIKDINIKDGYSLRIDLANLSASIINSNKRREKTMALVPKAKSPILEDLFNEVKAMIDNAEVERKTALEEAQKIFEDFAQKYNIDLDSSIIVDSVNIKFDSKQEQLDNVFKSVADFVEVPDEINTIETNVEEVVAQPQETTENIY